MTRDPQGPEAANGPPKADRSIVALLSDLADETILLMRQELALLKAELQDKFSRAGSGTTALAAGALILFSGWLVLLAAAVLALATVMPPWLAALIVGLVVLAVGLGLLLLGRSRFTVTALLPGRTLRSLREDEAWLRQRLQ